MSTLGRSGGALSHKERCIGCLLGAACGDILGAPFEFQSRSEIITGYGPLAGLIPEAWEPSGRYTDDTEMALALATSLIKSGGIDPALCAATYAEFFSSEPRRGYGPAVTRILMMLSEGADYRLTGRAIYPEGSFANGGAMRIAPVGLSFRNAGDVALRAAVRAALLCTHVHPDAVDGAFAQAKAVAKLAKTKNPQEFDGAQLLSELHSTAEGVLKKKLAIVGMALAESWPEERLLSFICTPNEYGAQFQIHAAEAVSCSLWAFLRHSHDPEKCVVQAVALGGDTDTIGAMTGALAGALHGAAWIPEMWYDRMENQPGIGRDFIIQTARQLAKLDLRSSQTGSC
jgi:poly(ADP-ribose) glycohydrolase ARH3